MKPNLLMAIILPFLFLYGLEYFSRHHIENPLKFNSSVNEENPYAAIRAIPVPKGFSRIDVDKDSFGNWLRELPLRKNRAVYLYNGLLKEDQSAQYAVLDLPIGQKNLQQCADVVMRLRAEYLYSQKRFGEIIFRDNKNHVYTPGIQTNKKSFEIYLETVFSFCGTSSLEKQMHSVWDLSRLKIGDVLITGGSPGHAMIVTDMARNKEGKTVYLLAQGFMPAQDIHVAMNPADHNLNPWYDLNQQTILTPAWTFSNTNFKTW